MNTKLSKDLKNNPWDSLLDFASEDDMIKHESQMLMFNFLSEVDKYGKLQGINKKNLANKIRTSASYITQLFRGSKPLNFDTIAKMQKALNIKFSIKAHHNEEMLISEQEAIVKQLVNPIEIKYNNYSTLYVACKNVDNTTLTTSFSKTSNQ